MSSWFIFLWPYNESHFSIPLFLLQLLSDVILIICCLFNCFCLADFCGSVPMSLCHYLFLSLVFLEFPSPNPESLSTLPSSSGFPSSPSWTPIFLSLGLCPPLSASPSPSLWVCVLLLLHHHPSLSGSVFSLYPYPYWPLPSSSSVLLSPPLAISISIHLSASCCLWPPAFCCSLE